MQLGYPIDEIYGLTGIDPWFLDQLQGLLETEKWLKRTPLTAIRRSKCWRSSNRALAIEQIAFATNNHRRWCAYRKQLGVIPVYKTVDTCAAEFEAYTPYYYSTYESETEVTALRSAQGDDPGGRP
jgi:carbamoyl-phosphate synthase large subunit